MRERHFPRLCHACEAPMARQESTCWKCGSAWETASPPHVAAGPARRVDVGRRAGTRTRTDIDRWTGEGGQIAAEPVGASR
jgi:hypothetical protein